MKRRSQTPSFVAWLARSLAPVLVLGFAACGAPREEATDDPREAAPAVAPPWTTRFEAQGSFLVAERVEIHGPDGLLDHVAATQDPERFAYEAAHEGGEYRQTFTLRPGAAGELRAQLDGWAVVAMQRLVIVEHLAPVPVTLRGAGNVSFHDATTGASGQDAPEHAVVGQRPGAR